MSYNVTLWTFSKKPNSTAQPSGAGRQIGCTIMDPSGVLAPVIELRFNTTPDTNPTDYNYAYVDAFHRYYFVRDWFYINGIWRAQLQVDPLASWKTQIGQHNLYILRSASANNGRVVDTTYPSIAGVTRDRRVNIYNPFNTAIENGVFIVGIINNDSNAIGAVSYYIFTNAQFRSFCAYLLGDTSWFGSPSDISTPLAKMLVNPFQYVASCMWLPQSPQNGGTTVTNIPFGWWTAPNTVSATKLDGSAQLIMTSSVSVPKHPQALTRGYYLLTDSYSSYYLIIPPFGAISLNANDLVDVDTIYLEYRIDPVTGAGMCYVMDDHTTEGQPDRHILTVVNAQAGVPVQLANNAPDVAGAIQQLLPGSEAPAISSGSSVFEMPGLAAGLIAAGLQETGMAEAAPDLDLEHSLTSTVEPLGAGLQKFASGIATVALNRLYPMQTIGSNGAFALGQAYIQLIGTFCRLADEDLAHRGRPLCENKQINTLSGFFQAAEADFQIPCTLSELQQIGSAAAAGMFWE